MDLAEAHIRDAGYRGFSFRDLAAELGIKSASVHHHFPTKAILTAAVVRRYGDRFFATVVVTAESDGGRLFSVNHFGRSTTIILAAYCQVNGSLFATLRDCLRVFFFPPPAAAR